METGDNQRKPRVVHTRDLRMRYGPTDVLKGVDLTVGQGEVVALLGPNGAGKTTTIEILEGFRKRSDGDVEVLGVDPDHGDEAWRARLGVVLQSWRDHGRWRVRELLSDLTLLYQPYRERVFDPDELIGLVGLTDHADRRIGTLSGGQRRRLYVAVGLIGQPDLLFLDEPTVGFDPEARREFHDLLRRLSGTTILLTTHDLAEAEKLADRIVILVSGRVVADGTAAQLAARIAGKAEVRYRLHGEEHVLSVADSTTYVRELFAEHGKAVDDLEVRRASLEDVYLALVRESERESEAVAA
ncbi:MULTISPECIES: ABC transporter ATP-binding protein [Saccharothrix]|uniref:ABC transporter ATP-binding protein n=1 Tax=Saccharothrix TaxID=2071 RepID=UPI000940227D|nr:ABC transporter ATP-binding protein [Saccharothrix sp. CB00851]OKI16017.1 multidrug ABC transporter ATP-binding protein [Saccharothrix sp. CB00851]